MTELGIASKMYWVPTSMGFFFNGRLHDWGNPVALLRLPGVSLITKFRYALFAFLCVQRKNWGVALETHPPANGLLAGVARLAMMSSGAPSSTSSFTNMQTPFPPHGCGLA